MFLLQPQKVKVLGLHLAEGLVLGPVVFLTLARAVRDQETAWVAEQIFATSALVILNYILEGPSSVD